MYILKYFTLLLVLMILVGSTSIYASPSTLSDTVRVLVKIKKSTFKESSIVSLRGKVLVKYDLIPYVVVEIPRVALEHLRRMPGILSVELDGLI